MYSADTQDGKIFKGWGKAFRQRYTFNLFEQCLYFLKINKGE
jgi:hypothetical protein